MIQTKNRGKYQILPGNPEIPGATETKNGYNFSIEVPNGKKAELLLYRKGHQRPFLTVPLPEEERTGTISSVEVTGITAEKFSYAYQMEETYCLDPYAKAVEGRERFGAPMEKMEDSCRCLLPKHPVMRTASLNRPYEETTLYKLHVRGFTKDGSSHVKSKGTFRGVIEKIPYLKELGINAVELMPAYEYFEWTSLEEPVYVYPAPEEPKRVNFWGYGTKALYFAPKASFSSSADAVSEFAEMVDALHENGIECLMEFCFAPGTPAGFMLQVLHHWQLCYQIDGFHLVGDASLVQEASKDALLRKTKLIFLGFDGSQIYGGKRPWFRNLGEHNQGYQYHIRRFLKGDEGSLLDFVSYLKRSPETHGVINYLADHDGFTLYDSVSYEQKHNLENGEDNMDGSNENLTWNCGAEGATRKPSVRELRLRQLKNAVMMLMTSQGTPMIYAGDEFGNSQKGNNNAWCQDNKTGWVDWRAAARNQEFAEFVRGAVRFRNAHAAFHGEREPRLMDYKSYGCPDLSFHSQRAWYSQMENTCRFIGVMYCGKYYTDKDGNRDDDLYIAYNMHWNPHELALPSLPEQKGWYLTVNTNDPAGFLPEEEQKKITSKTVMVPPRSIVILTGRETCIKKESGNKER